MMRPGDAQALRQLKSVEGINISDGLNFCGDDASLLKFATTFYRNIEIKAREIDLARTADSLEFYTIKVHALKSTARMLGATELSSKALALEEAGRRGDREFIDANTGELLELYLSYKDRLTFLDKVFRPPMGGFAVDKRPKTEVQKAYAALLTAVTSLDADVAEDILSELSMMDLDPDEADKVKKLSNYLENYDWDNMERILKGGN